MLEEEFQTAETRPQPFPWPTVALLAALAFALGASLVTAVLLDRGTAWRQLVTAMLLALALLMGWVWTELRRRVREWQRAYGVAVEYVARRKREREGGLRFEAP